jgi:uncharacterized protein (DUF433 family)
MPLKTLLNEPAIITCWLVVKSKAMTERIVVDPNIHFGKPYIAGTRIPVHDVLQLLEEGLSFAQIILDCYPDLTVDDIHACMHYPIDTDRSGTALI